jgi:DNA replication protein DnaC
MRATNQGTLYYSVPYRFVRAEVDVRLTARGVEIFHKGERIAVHLRSSGNRKHTTVSEHMPSSHRRYAGWTIERIREDARKIGKATAALCEQILESRPHPEQGYRACLGIVRLAGSYGAARVEAAAEHAIEIGARTYGSVKSILDNKLDRRPAPRRAPRTRPRSVIPTSAGRATTIEENAHVLRHPTLDQLHALGLHGMAKAFADLANADEPKDLVHADWLALLLDKEISWRRDKRLAARLSAAKLRHQASVEDVDYRAARGLDRAMFQRLSEGDWINAHDNLVLVGPAGVGKSWLACAIGHKACRDNRAVLYHRWPKLCGDLALARGDGRHSRLIRALGRADLLILDDFGLEPLDAAARHDLLEILEERYGRRSTIVTSQLPLSAWHEVVGDPTYADAILDRLVHNAHRIELTGESLRRARGKPSKAA